MESIRLGDLLAPENVAVRLSSATKPETIDRLIDLLGVGDAEVRDEIRASVMKREEIQSTGIGYGIAIPHGRAAIEPPIVAAMALTEAPVPYDSVDGRPARIFILMVTRLDATGLHVRALAHLARLLGNRSFRQALLGCETREDLLAMIRGEESP